MPQGKFTDFSESDLFEMVKEMSTTDEDLQELLKLDRKSIGFFVGAHPNASPETLNLILGNPRFIPCYARLRLNLPDRDVTLNVGDLISDVPLCSNGVTTFLERFYDEKLEDAPFCEGDDGDSDIDFSKMEITVGEILDAYPRHFRMSEGTPNGSYPLDALVGHVCNENCKRGLS